MDNSEDRQNLSNPVIVAPYDEPDCHWRLDDRFRATDTISKGRRPSGNYMSVPKTRSGHATEDLFAELEATGVQPHKLINDIREGVAAWSWRNYPGAPHGTRRLLEHWAGEHSVPRPFFAQRDAVESLAFIRHGRDSTAEEARKALRDVNENYNDSLPRMAVKMATGTGKTLAMAMWACCLAAHTKRRVNILVLTPNLTVTSRLKELDPSTAEGAALYRNLLPRGMALSGKLNVVVTNYHRWQRRDASGFSGDPGDLKPFLSAKRREITGDGSDSILETDAQMLSRILGSGGANENWFVFNDEAHHCYRPPKVPKGEDEQAALWYNALMTLQFHSRLAGVYDFSATPMYLKLPQSLKHPLFPWIISDYPLIEAVEAGLTKIPRVPVSDDRTADKPLYRNIFTKLKPGERNKLEAFHLPGQLKTLIDVIYEDYCLLDKAYEGHGIKPVFIVVANTKQNAKAIWETIAGRWGVDGVPNSPGSHTLWSNVSDDGTLKQVPPTLLTYSAESKDGEATVGNQADDAMKRQRALFCRRDKIAAKDAQAYVNRLFDTVGKPGQPGEHIRCVVSVNQLTEGWDARTVTHILGFRAFKSELLCEQVAGRALRRTSFPGGESGRLEPEYARILGVPFTFMRGSGPPPPPPASYRVYTLPGRKVQRIEFPNVIGFRPVNRVEPVKLSLSPERMKPIELADPTTPTETLLEGSAGEAQTAETQPWTRTRVHYVIANDVARHVIEHIEQLEEQPVPRAQLFATTLKAVVQWMKGTGMINQSPDRLREDGNRWRVAQAIYEACLPFTFEDGSPQRAVFASEMNPADDDWLDTAGIDYTTSLGNRYPLQENECATKSEINVAACHSALESTTARALDEHDRVVAWARNYRLGWQIPYLDAHSALTRWYEPDFVAQLNDANGSKIHLVIECKGIFDADALAKEDGARRWCEALSNDPRGQGRWEYAVVADESVAPQVELAIMDALKPPANGS